MEDKVCGLIGPFCLGSSISAALQATSAPRCGRKHYASTTHAYNCQRGVIISRGKIARSDSAVNCDTDTVAALVP